MRSGTVTVPEGKGTTTTTTVKAGAGPEGAKPQPAPASQPSSPFLWSIVAGTVASTQTYATQLMSHFSSSFLRIGAAKEAERVGAGGRTPRVLTSA